MQIDWTDLITKAFLTICTTCFAIEITPIKINPITWFCKRISNNINKERDDKINDIAKKLDEHIDLNKQYEALAARTNVIRFSEELKMKRIPSEEAFDIIIEDINFYEKYCADHKDFKNNKCNMAIAFIKDSYKKYYLK